MSNTGAFLFRSAGLSAAVAILATILFPPAAVAQAQSAVGDGYVVTFRSGTTSADRAAATRGAGAALRFNFDLINAAAVRVPNVNALAALQRNLAVVSIVPDHPVFAYQNTLGKGGGSGNKGGKGGSGGGEPAEVVPEGVQRVGEPTTGTEGAGVGIMIGDTGIDWTHPDLNVAPEKFDAFGGDCMDGNGHGTHVAGTAAARKNGSGVVGVAPGATLYCGKVLADNGSGSDSNLIALLQWVVNQNAAGISPAIGIVNFSLGRPKADGDMNGPVHNAIKAAHSAGVTVVTSAGNDPFSEVNDQMPAGLAESVAVASTTAQDGDPSKCVFFAGSIPANTASYFTTDGALDPVNGIGVTVSAPGGTRENVGRSCRISCEGILSTAIGGGTTKTIGSSPACGTSMAAPHVSGLAARRIAAGLSGPENIRNRLRLDAEGKGTAPLDSPGSAYTFDDEREGVAVWKP